MKAHKEPAEEGSVDVLPMPEKFTEPDETLSFLNSPHTISVGIAFLAALLYTAFTRTSTDFISNTKYGLGWGCLIFLVFSMLQFKDGLFKRPHPAFWRIVTGLAVLYIVGVVFLLFQTPEDARRLFTYIDPKLGVPLPERNYAEDCTLYTPNDPVSSFRNLYNTIYDEFIIAHFLGWFGKAFLFRDLYISWFWSVLFEVCELSLSHVLPNFKECWWDQIILDVLVCNGLGIFCGHMVMKWFEMKTFNWVGKPNAARRPWWQLPMTLFTPSEWTPFKWQMFSSPRRFFSVIMLIILAAATELNCFFLKATLWHPPSHPLVIGRLFLMWLFGLPGLREFYQYTSDPKCNKLGTNAWLTFTMIGLETFVWLKFSGDLLEKSLPTPPIVIYLWAGAISTILLGAFVYFYLLKRDNTPKALKAPESSSPASVKAH